MHMDARPFTVKSKQSLVVPIIRHHCRVPCWSRFIIAHSPPQCDRILTTGAGFGTHWCHRMGVDAHNSTPTEHCLTLTMLRVAV